MTKEEWLTCTDPGEMLDVLSDLPLSRKAERALSRKMRWFCCAACRLAWCPLPAGPALQAVEVAERFADGYATPAEREAAEEAAEKAAGEAAGAAFWAVWDDPRGLHGRTGGAKYLYSQAADVLARQQGRRRGRAGKAARGAAHGRLCDLIREVVGNPFRPLTFAPRRRTPGVLSLAQATYEERLLPSGELDPARLAVLADALEEAGCTDADILDHLRSPGPHVRGCWALDLVLGKG